MRASRRSCLGKVWRAGNKQASGVGSVCANVFKTVRKFRYRTLLALTRINSNTRATAPRFSSALAGQDAGQDSSANTPPSFQPGETVCIYWLLVCAHLQSHPAKITFCLTDEFARSRRYGYQHNGGNGHKQIYRRVRGHARTNDQYIQNRP